MDPAVGLPTPELRSGRVWPRSELVVRGDRLDEFRRPSERDVDSSSIRPLNRIYESLVGGAKSCIEGLGPPSFPTNPANASLLGGRGEEAEYEEEANTSLSRRDDQSAGTRARSGTSEASPGCVSKLAR